eukprot:774823-Pyramimonas_sp.AAC.4
MRGHRLLRVFIWAAVAVLYAPVRTVGWGWQEIAYPGARNTLHDVKLVNATHGWAVGVLDTILHTVDGGGTWVAAIWTIERTAKQYLQPYPPKS